MCICLHVKYPLCLLLFLFFFEKTLENKAWWKSVQWAPNCFMRTERHDEAKSRSSQFCERVSKWIKIKNLPEFNFSCKKCIKIISKFVKRSTTRNASTDGPKGYLLMTYDQWSHLLPKKTSDAAPCWQKKKCIDIWGRYALGKGSDESCSLVSARCRNLLIGFICLSPNWTPLMVITPGGDRWLYSSENIEILRYTIGL
jgi:hypothetical protein